MAVCLSLTLLPLQSNAAPTEPASSLPAPKPVESAEANTLIIRLNEINSMDMSRLKSADKKSIRKEVRSINHRLREIGGGVYLSAGAVIIIIIILIIVL